MVNFKTVQKIHKKLMYKDKCDIYEFKKELDDNGATKTRKQKVPKYLDVPCKVSFSLRTWDTFSHKMVDVTPYEKQPKIFMEVEYKVEPGYYFEVRRLDDITKEVIAEYKGQCGLPQVCLSHQEILLDTRGNC